MALATATVLVVDDCPESVCLLQDIMRAAGYQVAPASQGEEALRLARQSPPAVIISDLRMPVMDGYALCRACAQDPLLRAVPVILLTAGCIAARDKALAYAAGARHLLRLPIELAVLCRVVREAIAAAGSGACGPDHPRRRRGEAGPCGLPSAARAAALNLP